MVTTTAIKATLLALALVAGMQQPQQQVFVSAFACPSWSSSSSPTAQALTMNCFGACGNEYAPCIFYSQESTCSRNATTNAECVDGEPGSAGGDDCAIECFYPFSGAANESWNFMITTVDEYKKDVVVRAQSDPSFRLAKKPIEAVEQIMDLQFPPTTTDM